MPLDTMSCLMLPLHHYATPPHRLSLINNPLSPMIAILNPPLRLLMSICGRFYAGTYSISQPFFSRPAAFTLPRAATMYTTLDERLLPGLNTLPKHHYIAAHDESRGRVSDGVWPHFIMQRMGMSHLSLSNDIKNLGLQYDSGPFGAPSIGSRTRIERAVPSHGAVELFGWSPPPRSSPCQCSFPLHSRP